MSDTIYNLLRSNSKFHVYPIEGYRVGSSLTGRMRFNGFDRQIGGTDQLVADNATLSPAIFQDQIELLFCLQSSSVVGLIHEFVERERFTFWNRPNTLYLQESPFGR
jgi:hypothetical protein